VKNPSATPKAAQAHDERQFRLASLASALKAKGLRMTPQRKAILEALVMHQGHPTVEELHTELLPRFPSMSLATVYKAMTLLKKHGQVLELEFSSRDNRFDGHRPHPHPHLICTGCGAVVDPRIPGLDAVLDSLEQDTGYAVTSHRLDFYGLCPECEGEK